MKKVVINACFGGFSLSPEALLWMYERGATHLAVPVEEYFERSRPGEAEQALRKWKDYQGSPAGTRSSFLFIYAFTPDEKCVLTGDRDIERDDPLLVQCVETLGKKANGGCASLVIREIPDDVGDRWHVEEYDGNEHIAEDHRTW